MRKFFTHHKAESSSQTQPDNPTVRELDNPLGLSSLYYPGDNPVLVEYGPVSSFTTPTYRSSDKLTVDSIVAVHGLDGHRERTWTAENGRLWLRDFLPLELPYARIFTFGYDSILTFSKSSATIADFAIGLLDELDNVRTGAHVRDQVIGVCTLVNCRQEKQRPLILIGHSMGGIVIKQVKLDQPWNLFSDADFVL